MVVDASVWVSSIVVGDLHHDASERWFKTHLAERNEVVAPTLALVEVAGAISRRAGVSDLGREAVLRLMRAPGLRMVTLNQDLAEEAARIAADLQIRGSDAVYVAVAHRLAIPLVTWDQELLERAARFIQVAHP